MRLLILSAMLCGAHAEPEIEREVLSPDGRFSAVRYADGTIRVIDRTDEPHRLIKADRGDLLEQPFDPAGRSVAWARAKGVADRYIRVGVLNLITRETAYLHLDRLPVSVVPRPGGNAYAVVDRNGQLQTLRSLDRVRGPWEWADHKRPVQKVAVSADGTRAVSIDAEGIAILWHLGAKARVWPPFAIGEGAWTSWDVALTADGRGMAACDGETVYWVNLTGDRPRAMPLGKGVSFGLSPKGDRIAIGQAEGTVRLIDLKGDNVAVSVDVGFVAPRHIAFSPDGGRMAVTVGLGEVVLYDIAAGELTRGPKRDNVYAVSFSSGGNRLVVAGHRGVFVWDIHARKVVTEFDSPNLNWRGVRMTPDGKTLIASSSGRIHFVDVVSGVETGRHIVGLDDIRDIAISGDGSLLIIGGAENDLGTLNVVSLESSRPEVIVNREPPLERQQLERFWEALDSEDQAVADAAFVALGLRPEQTLPLLRAKLPPAAEVRGWIDDLASSKPEVRKQAERRLLDHGRLAAGWVRDAKPGAKSTDHELRLVLLEIDLRFTEPRNPARWERVSRLLDWIDTDEAEELRRLVGD